MSCFSIDRSLFKLKLASDSILWILITYAATYFIYQDFDIPLTLGFLFVLLVVGINVLKKTRIKVNYIGLALVLLNVVVALQYIRPDANINIDTIMCLLAMLMFSFAAMVATPSGDVVSRALCYMRIVAFVFTTFILFFTICRTLFIDTLYPILSKPSQMYFDRFLPRGFNPCLGASYTYNDYVIVMGIASVSASLFNKSKKGSKIKDFFLLGYFMLGIFLIERRGELAAICIALWFLWVLVNTGRKRVIIIAITVGLACLLYTLVTYYFPIIRHWDAVSRYVRSIEMLTSGQDITSGRTELYAIAIDQFKDNPVFGIGWKSYATYIPAQFRVVHGEKVMDVHNNYLQFLCESGVVGTFFILIPLMVIIVAPIRNLLLCVRRLRRTNNRIPELEDALCASIVAVVIQLFFFFVGFLDPCFYKSYYWCFYAISVVFAIYGHRTIKAIQN